MAVKAQRASKRRIGSSLFMAVNPEYTKRCGGGTEGLDGCGFRK
jgi:hypothetical protein